MVTPRPKVALLAEFSGSACLLIVVNCDGAIRIGFQGDNRIEEEAKKKNT